MRFKSSQGSEAPTKQSSKPRKKKTSAEDEDKALYDDEEDQEGCEIVTLNE
jgi:hypothetical protein